MGTCGLEKTRGVEGLEAVADTEDGLDVLVGVAAELLAQTADVHVQRARADFGAVAPDLHEERFARDDLARVLHQ